MEGLDLFVPTVEGQSSSDESIVDITSDEDWDKAVVKTTEHHQEAKVITDRDFEIEKV